MGNCFIMCSQGVFVSIVAPVYNVAHYLPSFINSIIRQSFLDWELILVDDGSTDSSGLICDDYSYKDNRIKVIHKTNGGVSSARNAGIKEAKGRWLLLPDADDSLFRDALQVLLSYAKDDVDLIGAGYVRNVLGKIVQERKPSETKKMTVSDYIDEIGIIPQARNTDRYCWNKLFRLSVIKENSILFNESLFYREDILFIYQYLMYCTRLVQSISYKMYIYYRRNTGAAISLQEQYTSKSSGLFLAMTCCYDILIKMGASEIAKRRMKDEVLNTYKSIIKLIDKSGVGRDDKRVYTQKLHQYYNNRELIRIGCKSILHRVKRILNP